MEANVSFPMETAKLILAFSVWKPLGIIFRHLCLQIHRLPIGVHAKYIYAQGQGYNYVKVIYGLEHTFQTDFLQENTTKKIFMVDNFIWPFPSFQTQMWL